MNAEEQDQKLELQLRRDFQAMRAEDERIAPEFSVPANPAARGTTGGALSASNVMFKVAAVASIAVAAGLFVGNRSTEDPAAMYVAIMASSTLATDQLLAVSDGALPEMADFPAMYDFDADTAELPGLL